MVSGILRAGLIAAAIACGAGVAQAQQPTSAQDDQDTAEMCVYFSMTDDEAMAVAEAYLDPNAAAEVKAQSTAGIDRTTKLCAAKFGIPDDVAPIVAELGVYGVVSDFLATELVDMGADEESLSAIFDFYDGLEDADFDILYESDWRQNADFVARMKAGLVEIGLPNNDLALASGLELIDIIAMSDMAAFDLSFAELGGEGDDPN